MLVRILLSLSLLSFACREPLPPFDPADYELTQLELAISFPPVEDESDREFSREKLAELAVRKIRFAEEWAFREAVQGEYNWGPLDRRLQWAEQNELEVMLTIQSNGPEWACQSQNERSCNYRDNQEFANYLSALLQRYPNQLDRIQFGNEWQSDFWYIGTAQEFVASNNVLYQAVQTHSPQTTVVLGGFTSISLRAMAACTDKLVDFYDDEGTFYDQATLDSICPSSEAQSLFDRIDYVLQNAQYDEVDLHLYDDPENWDEVLAHFRSINTSPLIVSEFGGPNLELENDSESYQAERVEYYIRKLDSLQVPQAYFFKLVEGSNNPVHASSGLFTRLTKRPKESFEIFRRFSNP
ncbi:MAG: hypothetical protein AAGM67_15360 [Bacteroidota bacterium]